MDSYSSKPAGGKLLKKIKIRHDYVPKADRIAQHLQQRPAFNAATATTTSHHPLAHKMKQQCPKCSQWIPVTEMDEHVRIELLDPKWKEQKEREMGKKRESNLTLDQGRDIAAHLKQLAEVRRDIFGGDALEAKRKIQEEMKKAKAKESIAWDGYSATTERILERTQQYASTAAVQQKFWEQTAAVEAQQVGPGTVFTTSYAAQRSGMNEQVANRDTTQQSFTGAAVRYGFSQSKDGEKMGTSKRAE